MSKWAVRSLVSVACVFLYAASIAYIALPALLLMPKLKDQALKPAKLLSLYVHANDDLDLAYGRACTQNLSVCVDAFNFQGSIEETSYKPFLRQITALMNLHPEVKTLCLNSGGGNHEAAAQIAAFIKANHLDTCVADTLLTEEKTQLGGARFTASCESACVFIVYAGIKRLAVGDRFVVGLHSSKRRFESSDDGDRRVLNQDAGPDERVTFMSDESEQNVLREYKGKLSITDETFKKFLVATALTPASRMYYASEAEQMEHQIFTQRLH